MKDASGNRAKGTAYEEKAAAYLKERGFMIVERNFRCRTGEIDLIAREGETLVFVEVKYRKSPGAGGPLPQVGYRKQRRISRAAQFYLLKHGLYDRIPCRFDVVGYLGEEPLHIRDAFPFVP